MIGSSHPTPDSVLKPIEVNRSVLFTGLTGVGKSVVARAQLEVLQQSADVVPVFIGFSAQTSSLRTQEMIEGKTTAEYLVLRLVLSRETFLLYC